MENSNYKCVVVEIDNIYPLENLDNLVGTKIFFGQVLMSKKVKIGDIGLFFPVESKLGLEFCNHNKLIRKKDIDGKNIGGMFDSNRRVRCQTLRGNRSMGFFIELNSLKGLVKDDIINKLKIGDEFHELDSILICDKYIPGNIKKLQLKSDNKVVKRISRLVPNQFRLHVDTDNYRRNTDKILPNDIIGIHYKKHGCQVTYANILVKKKLNWYEKLLKSIGVNIIDTEYDIVVGSRRVVKNEFEEKEHDHFYGSDIWTESSKSLLDKIPKGFSLYGEILGFTKENKAIQPLFDYGCKSGEHKVYIYRITYTNVDGHVFELDDYQIQQYCQKYNLNYKDTFYYYGYAKDLYPELDTKTHWAQNFIERLEKDYNNKNCWMSTNIVPEEGIVIRKMDLFDYIGLKLKSANFFEFESKELDKGNIGVEDEI